MEQSTHVASNASPRWLWMIAIVLGPVLLAFVLYQFINHVSYNDVVSCGPAVHPLRGAPLGLLLFQAPAALLLIVGLISRARWHGPVILASSCGLAIFLFFVAYSLHSPWPEAIGCRDFAAIIRMAS